VASSFIQVSIVTILNLFCSVTLNSQFYCHFYLDSYHFLSLSIYYLLDFVFVCFSGLLLEFKFHSIPLSEVNSTLKSHTIFYSFKAKPMNYINSQFKMQSNFSHTFNSTQYVKIYSFKFIHLN